ncbi:LytR/AlgR family response regulator transcription factor [Paraclostridium bifermentans]|uniref:LytR/AlgR family response regulator transcription factor n=1 Tax=Paraclostridium bifermentans TaxID=1490 RepID=UPI0018AACB6A|nr:LytTR family DNA-binding domain-containing protein [Paraclostridium bifermentans]
MLRIAVCEDCSTHRNLLINYIDKVLTNQDYKIYSFASGEDLLKNYPKKLDILLLDIQMKNINGIDSAKEIRKFDDKVEIIFITALREYAIQGYEVRAYRYLIKPVKYEDLSKNIQECKNILKKRTNECIFIKCNKAVVRIPICDVEYIEKISRDIVVHTYTKKYISRMNIGEIEEKLEKHNFFRCHTGYLINLESIRTVTSNEVVLDTITLPVSRPKMKKLKLLIINSLGELI